MPIAKKSHLAELLELDAIFDKLELFESPNVFNPWRDSDPLDVIEFGATKRWERLQSHFLCTAKFLLIGEAPGYQGCHFSGVAFTNESLLLRGLIPRVSVVGRITTRTKPWSEPSASIVWKHLHYLGIADKVVLWNAFAWHPFQPGIPMSNRAPTRVELLQGLPVLQAVLEYFKDATVVAVGNVAEKTLKSLGVQVAAKVRHPSMGGANQFRQQLTELV